MSGVADRTIVGEARPARASRAWAVVVNVLTILSPVAVALLGVRVMVLRMTAGSPMDIDMGERVFLLMMLVGLPMCCYLASGIALLVGSRARQSPLARLTVTLLVSTATTTAAVLLAT